MNWILHYVLFAALLVVTQARAAEAPPTGENPFQDYWSFRVENRFFLTQGTLPSSSQVEYDLRSLSILPVPLSDEWMWISVPILELSVSPVFNPMTGGYTHPVGFTDLQYLGILTPKKENGFHWGLGPAAIFPTATEMDYGFGKWQLGVTAAADYIDPKWVVSIALAQEWSVAGNASRQSTSLLQGYYYIARNLADGWMIGSSPEMRVDWKAPGGNMLELPFGIGAGKSVALGGQKMNVWVEGQYYVVTPKVFGPEWLLELRITPIIPRPL